MSPATPNEEKIITLKIPVSELSYYDVISKQWKVEKTSYNIEIATSSKDNNSTQSLIEVR